MASMRSRVLWVLAFAAGTVLAAVAVVGGLVPQKVGISEPAAAVISPKGDPDDYCSLPTSMAVETVSGSHGGWSYFPSNTPITLDGAISYFCNGQPYSGPSAQFWMEVRCDGNLLPVGYEDFVTDSWNAVFTAPSSESVCSLTLRAETDGGAVAEVNETLVFMADPSLRPTVALTNPQAGVLIYPDTVQLVAEASVAAPATITQVEFFDQAGPDAAGQVWLGEATAAPYVVPDVALDPAEHWITAVATDSRGYRMVSEPKRVVAVSNKAPSIRVTSPTVGASYSSGDLVTVNAVITDDGATGLADILAYVRVFDSAELVHEVVWRTGPSTYVLDKVGWQPTTPGIHHIFVEAADRAGAVTRAGPVTITVGTDAAPTVKIVTPVDGLFQQGFAAIPLTASASDDRSISQIDFTIAPWPGTSGAVVVAASVPAASALYRDTWTATASWTPTVAGRYVVRARARDGASRPDVASDPVEVYVDDNNPEVNFKPKVRIRLPVSGDGFRMGTAIPVSIEVQDGFGELNGIDRVYLYQDGAALAVWSAIPPNQGSQTWIATGTLPTRSLLAGTHSLIARANDKLPGGGIVGDSPAVVFNLLAAADNPAPVASLALPVGVGALGIGTGTTLSVQARDLNVDGSIGKIEIFANGEMISPVSPGLPLNPVTGRANEATTSMAWTPQDSGDYDLFARVTDNAGLSADSPRLKLHVAGVAGNPAPTATMVAPENGTRIELGGGPLTLTALVADPGASAKGQAGINRVEFFDGATRLGTAPNQTNGVGGTVVDWVWLQPSEGAHALRARVRDAEGTVSFSEPINLFIIGGPPTIRMLAPVSGAPGLVAPETVWAMVDVADDSGVIGKVEYFDNGLYVGETQNEPYDFRYTGLGAGGHQLTAKAWDKAQHSTLSAPVDIAVAVNQAPTISISQPLSTNPPGQFAEGSNIPIMVVANDPDENRIDKVEYLRNGVVFLSNPQSPYNVTWNNAQAGLASLTARVTDIRGGVGTTPTATTIEIVAARPPVVTLTAPSSGSALFVGDTVTLSATATDPDQSLGGQILSVQFFRRPQGSTATGTALGAPITAPPYTFDWLINDSAIGTAQEIYAKAVDSGPAGKNTTMSSASAVSVRLNHAPTNVRFHPYTTDDSWPIAWGNKVEFPAMPSLFTPTVLFEVNPSYRVQANGRIRLCAIADDEDGDGASGNLAGMRFYLSKPGVANDVLLGSTTTRSAPGSYCSWQRSHSLNQGGYSIDVDLDGTQASQDVQYLRAEAFDARGLSTSTAVNPDAGQDGYIPCFGDHYNPSNASSPGSICTKFSIPIAITALNATTTPCGGTGATCTQERFLLPTVTGEVRRLEAERYDSGGQGVGMFEKNYVLDLSLRGDHAAINCQGANSLHPNCRLEEFDNGEYRRYSVSMSSDGRIAYTVRFLPPEPRVWLKSPENGIFLDKINGVFRDVDIRALVSGYSIGSGTNSTVQVEFFRRNPDDGSTTSITVTGPNGSPNHDAHWHPPSSVDQTWQIGARATVKYYPDGLTGALPPVSLVGAIKWRTVHWVNVLPAGVSLPEELPLAEPVGSASSEKAPGVFEGRETESVSCSLPEPRLEAFADGTLSGWFLQESCPIDLPANDYYFNLSSKVDGMVVDSIDFARVGSGGGEISLEISSPAANNHFAVNAPVALLANFTGSTSASIVRYEVTKLSPGNFQPIPGSTQRIDNVGAAPAFQGLWSASEPAPYLIQAFGKLAVAQGSEYASTPIRVFVDNAVVNQVPTVTLTNPSTNLTMALGSSMTLGMTATDDGEVDAASTRFLIDNGVSQLALPATGNNGSYAADWTPGAGTYTITAQASDTTGLSATSSPRTVNVVSNLPPTIAWTAPSAGATFTPGSNITLTATASDADGTVSKVEFFKDNGASLIGAAAATNSTYTLVWLNVPAGNYTLIAKVTDDLDASTFTTPPITIEVADPAMCFALPPRPENQP